MDLKNWVISSLLAGWLDCMPRDLNLYSLASAFLRNVNPENSERLSDKKPDDTKQCAKEWAVIESSIKGMDITKEDDRTLNFLKDHFSLDAAETSIVAFMHAYQAFGPLETYVDLLEDWMKIEFISRMAGIDESGLFDRISPAGGMVRSGICVNAGHSLLIKRWDLRFGLSPYVQRFFSQDGCRPLSSQLLESPPPSRLDLASFDLPESTLKALQAIMSAPIRPCSILLYGKPGTGKTEFSKVLCRSLDTEPRFLKPMVEDGTRSISHFLLASQLVDPEHEILVVDEADDLLNEDGISIVENRRSMKGKLNSLLDASAARIIFISNDTRSIHESVLRRMSMHVAFEDFSLKRRQNTWTELSKERPVFSNGHIRMLATEYHANASRILQVLDTCNEAARNGVDEATCMEIAEDMLARSNEIMYHIPRKPRSKKAAYDFTLINTDLPAQSILDRLKTWHDQYDGDRQGLSMLFYGKPGTGKTAFARYLVEEIGMVPMVRRASDILSPFVGMDERNIRQAFEEAEDSALIIDEADSLIADRQNARHGWERSLTNELLTCMESFRGLFIATTNMQSSLDTASMRRFAFKVEFKGIRPEKILSAISLHFPDVTPSMEEEKELQNMELNIGDIEVVHKRRLFEPPQGAQEIIVELRHEIETRDPKRQTIGFLSR